MTEAQTAQLKTLAKRIREDFSWYAGRFLTIKTKDSRIAPLVLNDTQRAIDDRWQADEAAGRPVRYLILKARQEGVSTYIAARMFHRTATRKNRSSLIVSHDEDSTVSLFDMVKLYNDSLPDLLRPMQRYSNRRELVFENPSDEGRRDTPGLRSRLSVALARNVRAGRSKTLHDVLCSEAAFYPDLRTLRTGLFNAVPMTAGTAIILETTANGVGEEFQSMWEAAKRGENGFTPLFFPWFVHKEYRRPFRDDGERGRFIESLTAEEHQAQALYGLEAEQLHWRREKAKEFDSFELFLQEYPENDVDCFLTSGSPALPVKALRERQKVVKQAKWRGYLETYVDDTDPKNPQEKIRFNDDPKGPLSVWKMPDHEREYVIGVDTSEGLDGGDYSSADIVDKETGEQVAQWHGLKDPDLLGSTVLPDLGWYFNNAEIGVERNNHGHVVLNELKKVYSKLFRAVETDELTNKTTEKLGWLTTIRSKPIMIDELRRCIREHGVIINSDATLSECLTFVRYPNGTTAAQENCKDDRVMSLAIALQILAHHPHVQPRRRRRVSESTYDATTGY